MSRTAASVWRISLFILAVASIFWLGAVNIRAMIGNDMLRTGTLEFEGLHGSRSGAGDISGSSRSPLSSSSSVMPPF